MPLPTIILLHGALGAREQLGPLAEALDGLGRVERLEFPGHGTTPLGGTPYDIEGLARWLGDTLDAAAMRAPRLVFGYSMAGYVALVLEARRPGTFAGIVTLGTKFAWSPDVAARECAKLDAATIRAKVPRFAAMLEQRHAGAGGWERVLRDTAGLIRGLGARPLLDATTLAAVRCPVLVAVGDADDTVGVEEAHATAALMPHARAEVIAGAPHPIERVPVAAMRSLVVSLRSGLPA